LETVPSIYSYDEGKRYGRIVNVSSLGGSLHYMTYGGTPAYSISKGALNALTRKLAAELVNTDISKFR